MSDQRLCTMHSKDAILAILSKSRANIASNRKPIGKTRKIIGKSGVCMYGVLVLEV